MAEVLIVIWVLTWMIKTATTDVIYSIKGQIPPRHRERMARIEAGSTEQRRYGVRGWAADLWDDGLRANTEWRRHRAARRAEARRQTPIDDLAELVREAQDVPKPDHIGAKNNEQPTTPVGKPPVESATDEPAKTSAPVPGRVIPLFPNKEIQMSNQPTATPNGATGEVTGLQSAIAYADAVAQAHSAHSTGGGEGYVGSLTSFGVTGNTISLVRQAQEASALAASAWKAASQALQSQHVVKEAYDANPDAGTQAFVQGE